MENNIKYFRSISHLSQADLGKMLNVSGATISSWEMDRTEPSMEQSIKMVKIFGCTLEELFKASPPTDFYSADEKFLIECYRKADEDTKNVVGRLLKYSELLRKEKK